MDAEFQARQLRSARVKGNFAGGQSKNLFQRADGLPQGTSVGERAEMFVWIVLKSSHQLQSRKLLTRGDA